MPGVRLKTPAQTGVPGTIRWQEGDQGHAACWRSESGNPPPKRVIVADDTLTADAAYRLACEGTALLWRGDFQNAKQLLQAMARRCDQKPARRRDQTPTRKLGAANDGISSKPVGGRSDQSQQKVRISIDVEPSAAFNQYRQAQSQRARTLAMLLIPFDADFTIPLRRAPDVKLACTNAWRGNVDVDADVDADADADAIHKGVSVASLRELLGIIGAHEWRRKGVEVAAISDRVYPHYGVFAPVRSEYIGLVANAPLADPIPAVAFDIGTGTGVLAALLAKRGILKIIATELDSRALACAQENLSRMNLNNQVDVIRANLFPDKKYGKASLIVCNPPWIPARPSSPIERAVYDPDNQMLRGFLSGLASHLTIDGEGWLILSDLAEHLGLRTRTDLLTWIDSAGLSVVGRIDVRPTHPRASDHGDLLHSARAMEVTSLWQLKKTLL